MSKPVKQIHLAAHFPGVNNTTVWSDPRSGSHIDFSSFAHPVPGLAVGPGSAGRTGRGMGGMAVPPGRAAECQARVVLDGHETGTVQITAEPPPDAAALRAAEAEAGYEVAV